MLGEPRYPQQRGSDPVCRHLRILWFFGLALMRNEGIPDRTIGSAINPERRSLSDIHDSYPPRCPKNASAILMLLLIGWWSPRSQLAIVLSSISKALAIDSWDKPQLTRHCCSHSPNDRGIR
jgi:hypothetical protein